MRLLSAGYLVSDVRSRPYTVRTDDVPKVHFSAMMGEEPEIELALVLLLCARGLLSELSGKPFLGSSLPVRHKGVEEYAI